MKKKINIILIGTILCLSMSNVMAQKTGFTFSFFNMAYYANTSPITQGYMGIGLERNVGDYISLKLELNNGFQLLYKITNGKILSASGSNIHEKDWEDSSGYSHYFQYHWSVPSFDINYQSKFFFRGNDKSGPYLSMGIGIRSVKYIFHVGSPDEGNNVDASEIPADVLNKDEYSENLTVIPLILRIGARGNMDGFFPDFSFGLGYNFSHDKTITDKTITKTWNLDVPKLSGVTITGSISFGIGW